MELAASLFCQSGGKVTRAGFYGHHYCDLWPKPLAFHPNLQRVLWPKSFPFVLVWPQGTPRYQRTPANY